MIHHPSNVKENEGWTYLLNSPKWHYFRDGRSLCRKFLLLGKPEFDGDEPNSPDNCAKCQTLRNKERFGKALDTKKDSA